MTQIVPFEKEPKMSDIADVCPETFEQDVLNSDIPVVVDVWAAWCGPCKAMLPIVTSVAKEKEFVGKVRFVKLDGGENKEFLTKLEIRSVPTFIIYHRGVRIAVRTGMFNIDQMRSYINSALEKLSPQHDVNVAA